MPKNNSIYEIARKIAASPYYVKRNFLYPKSLSAKYIFYRVVRPFLKLYYKLFKILYPNTPWTTPASIAIFKRILNKEMEGFEYGSGVSTIFFAKNLRRLIAIEHNPTWHQHVLKLLHKNELKNVDYQLIPADKTSSKGSKNREEDHFLSFAPSPEFQTYYSFIDRYPDNSFDFIIIDGRARLECTETSIRKLRAGGILVLDNSERKRYQPIHELLKDWPEVHTTTGWTDTTIWFKP